MIAANTNDIENLLPAAMSDLVLKLTKNSGHPNPLAPEVICEE